MYTRTLISTAIIGLLVIGTASLSLATEPRQASIVASSSVEEAESLYRQGMLQYEKGNIEEAIDLYTDSLELNPDSPEAYSARAGAWGILKEYEAAIADYSAAIDLDDTLAPAYGGRGLAKTLKGQLDEGVHDLWTAAQLFREQNQVEQYYKTLAIIEGVAP
jgi:tetratricopeptide (TPR) repeat protein